MHFHITGEQRACRTCFAGLLRYRAYDRTVGLLLLRRGNRGPKRHHGVGGTPGKWFQWRWTFTWTSPDFPMLLPLNRKKLNNPNIKLISATRLIGDGNCSEGRMSEGRPGERPVWNVRIPVIKFYMCLNDFCVSNHPPFATNPGSAPPCGNSNKANAVWC